MHFARVFLSVLVLLAPARLQAGSEPLIRIACVGDSITFGLNIPDREKACYPVVLAARLGARYEVRNFGISGATLLKNGDYSYWLLPEFKAALDYAPTAVILLLGTNDSKLNNAARRGDFEKDLNEMTDAFQSLPSQPKILLCTPPPLFGFLRSVQQAALEREIVPVIQRVAAARQMPLVDLQTALARSPELFPDGCHPNAAGAKQIAEAVFQNLAPIFQ